MNKKMLAEKILPLIYRMPLVNQIRMNGNKLYNYGKGMWQCKIRVIGKNNVIVFQKGGYLRRCTIKISGNNNVISIGSHSNLTNVDICIEDSGNQINIGENTSLCGKTHLACIESTSISIGNNCLFSSDIVLRSGDSHSILNTNGDRINPSKDIIIHDHVWIGHRVLINKGVCIRRNSVVGTGSIVTKDIQEENVILAGVPAHIVKRNINWDHAR